MRNSALRSIARTAALLALFPVLAQAHPGHDGHELTWDLGHLAAHPFATFGWLAAFGVTVWLAKRIGRKVGRVIPNAPSQDIRIR